jgi:hypothetical protein
MRRRGERERIGGGGGRWRRGGWRKARGTEAHTVEKREEGVKRKREARRGRADEALPGRVHDVQLPGRSQHVAAGIEARWSARPAPPPGVAGLLDDDTALDEALARAEREGVVHLASPAITIETRAAWRARNRYGGGVTAWRIAGHVGYFRYFPSNHIAEEVGAVATRTAEEVWRAVLDTDLVVPWCFIHDLRGVRGIARSHRGMGLEAYRAIAPRLRGSAIVATPVQEPLARAFQLLLQRDVLRGCTVHRRAVDALRPHLTLDLGAAGVSPDEAQWINELYGATELTLDRGRHVVLAPPAWRWASGRFRLRLALIETGMAAREAREVALLLENATYGLAARAESAAQLKSQMARLARALVG